VPSHRGLSAGATVPRNDRVSLFGIVLKAHLSQFSLNGMEAGRIMRAAPKGGKQACE